MSVVDVKGMLQHAYRHGYAVGALELVSPGFLEGVMMAAERARAAVILSLAEPHFGCFDFEPPLPAVEAAARRTSIPVAIHLDRAATLESAARGSRGFQGSGGRGAPRFGGCRSLNSYFTKEYSKYSNIF